jgi:hypothetical protein
MLFFCVGKLRVNLTRFVVLVRLAQALCSVGSDESSISLVVILAASDGIVKISDQFPRECSTSVPQVVRGLRC